MSILIKGMSKPTDCGFCTFENFGYCRAKGERVTSESGIDADCPLIEIAEQTDPKGVSYSDHTDYKGSHNYVTQTERSE